MFSELELPCSTGVVRWTVVVPGPYLLLEIVNGTSPTESRACTKIVPFAAVAGLSQGPAACRYQHLGWVTARHGTAARKNEFRFESRRQREWRDICRVCHGECDVGCRKRELRKVKFRSGCPGAERSKECVSCGSPSDSNCWANCPDRWIGAGDHREGIYARPRPSLVKVVTKR